MNLSGSDLPTRRRQIPHNTLSAVSSLLCLRQRLIGSPERQREVFMAIALNDAPIDVLAIKLDSTRNAVYKNLFDARRSLRMSMAANGHPVFMEDRNHD